MSAILPHLCAGPSRQRVSYPASNPTSYALQVSASEGARRAEVLTAELPVLRLQAAELQSAADAERQELTARHVAHVQVGPGYRAVSSPGDTG